MYLSLLEDNIFTDITAQQWAIYQSGHENRKDHKYLSECSVGTFNF